MSERHEGDDVDGATPPAMSLSRRSYLTNVAGVVGSSRVEYEDTGAEEPSFRTIVVPPGGHYLARVTDGDVFCNTLVDITAPNATFKIDADGSDWEVRNVGVRGVWDVVSDGHEQAVSVVVPSGATGVIDTFYFADGCPDDTYPGVTGIYVQREHAGALEISNVNIQDMPNNAIYASTMGRPDENQHGAHGGKGGVVKIRDSYAAACQAAHFRIGTTGSLVKNCVAVGGDRGVWAKFNDIRIVDSDLTGHSQSYCDGDIVCGSYGWEVSQQAQSTLDNTVFGHSAPGDQDVNYAGTIHGQSADRAPRTTPPVGVPLTPEDAAAGDARAERPTTRVRVAATAENEIVEYAFTVRGRLLQADGAAIDRTRRPDGGVRLRGLVTGPDHDEYWFRGSLTDWEIPARRRSYRVTVRDDAATDERETEHTLTVVKRDERARVPYEFTVEGTAARVSGSGTDPRGATTERGHTSVDDVVPPKRRSVTYRFDGRLVAWATTADPASYALFVDGAAVDLDRLPAIPNDESTSGQAEDGSGPGPSREIE